MSREIDFKEVFEQFHPKILHYLSRMTNPHEAEDIAQEVFDKVSRSLRSFKGESKLSTWLYRIATNAVIDRMRSSSFKRSSEHASLEDITGVEDRNVWFDHNKTSTDQTIISKEMSECIREFIDKLPSDYKTVILLSDLEGFQNQEIADILQVSLDTVKIRLHRARAKLREILNEGCDFYHSEQNVFACDRKPSQILPKPPK
ncbi:MAG: sigma-70 family RNA polymerase sigma factor [Proteobacteria bacterium]|nr:sigma-70 family RNA polymerase sigma factor [Pseudomonadota bacterium]